jgi:hypothetical protein
MLFQEILTQYEGWVFLSYKLANIANGSYSALSPSYPLITSLFAYISCSTCCNHGRHCNKRFFTSRSDRQQFYIPAIYMQPRCLVNKRISNGHCSKSTLNETLNQIISFESVDINVHKQ